MEYIRFESSEKKYGKKNLLQAEMEFLNIMKKLKYYKSLRRKESKVKTSFKKLITELKSEMKNFDKLLPESHYNSNTKKSIPQKTKYNKGRKSLEFEIAEIQAKLSKLQ